MTSGDAKQENREKLQDLLRELFQFEASELDFGVYKILNAKRERIDQFIEEDLLDGVEEALSELQAEKVSDLEEKVQEEKQGVLDAIGSQAFVNGDEVAEEYRDAEIVRDYLEAKRNLEEAKVGEETEAQVFNDLFSFFRRYYDDGDFFTKRIFSSRESKFYVPYNGEEVLLHWANRDQYYIKTSERFTDYKFEAGDFDVWFKLHQAEVPNDNVKGDTKYFVVRSEEPVSLDEEDQVLRVHFEYRPLDEDEQEHWMERYNEATGEDKSRLKRDKLCTAMYHVLLDEIPEAGPKKLLEQELEDKERPRLLYHLNRYSAKNTMDYFIHKDLRGFLRRELDFFLKNEVLHVDDFIQDLEGSSYKTALLRARAVRQIAERIIAFLAQIEDFQKRLFEKKKFVVQTDYLVTLDQVPEDLYDQILENEEQLDRWTELYGITDWDEDLYWTGEFNQDFLDNHPYIMIDTAFFDEDFKARLLTGFKNLDDAIDGVLIHGENFQAMNLTGLRYSKRVRSIYSDPPYNTGNDDFLYRDNYQHSSWISLMADRLELAREILSDSGVCFLSIDDNEYSRLKELEDSIFGPENFVANVIWQKNFSPKNTAKWFSEDHDYISVYARDRSNWQPELLPRSDEADSRYSNPDDDPRGPWTSSDLTGRNPYSEGVYEVESPAGKTFSPPQGRYWTISKDKFEELDQDNRIWWGEDGENMPRRKRFKSEVQQGIVPRTIWDYDEVGHTQEAKKELLSTVSFETREDVLNSVKPTRLIKRILQLSGPSDQDWRVLDFFAGSGTTAHAVIDYNRETEGNWRYILVEMGNYFDEMIRPRIQRVVFSSEWEDGKPQKRDGQTHVVKYHRIESYEDTLNNLVIKPLEDPQKKLVYEQMDDYMLHYMLDLETRESPSLLHEDAFEDPFDYEMRIKHGHESPEKTPIDLVETFHYLIGMHVEQYERLTHQDREYVVTRGKVRDDGDVETVVTIWRRQGDLDLDEEADWTTDQVLSGSEDLVYVNGTTAIPDAQPTELTFRERMEEGVEVGE